MLVNRQFRRVLLVLGLFAAVAVLSSCSRATLATGNSNNQQAEPFSNLNLGPLTADPDGYIGEQVGLTGRVVAQPGGADGGAWRVQVQADPDESETRFYVLIETDDLEISVDDYVRFKGTLDIDPRSRFDGAGEYLPFVRADVFEQIPSYEVRAPTRNLVEPKVFDTQFEVTVAIEKIEFAAKETRVYVRIDNATERTVRVNNNRMKLFQGPRELALKLAPAPDYDRLPADLPTVMSALGILTFPPAAYDEGSLRLTIGASTDDYTVPFEPFELGVAWSPPRE